MDDRFSILGLLPVLIGSLCILALMMFMARRESRRTNDAIQNALAEYEQIVDGKLWIGKDSEVLTTNQVNPESSQLRIEQLCRTPQGAFFIFSFTVWGSKAVDCKIEPCDETEAKTRLQSTPDAYVRVFGQPGLA